MAQEDGSGSSPAPPGEPDVDEEFHFLLCENCRQEVKCPKLLPCLHNVCLQCLQETKPVNCCPVCKAPHFQTDAASVLDNLLFANLHAKLSVFQMIKRGQDLVCDNCKKEGTYWCSECREFLCTSCFESHQRYLKRENHEARAVKDIKTESSKDFLTQFKNIAAIFCPNSEHKMQNLSIYCRACQRSLCCICAVLDSKHSGQHCHIREEIQRRQQELVSMSTELAEKKASYDRTCGKLREQVKTIVQVKNRTRELIQQKVEEMIRLVQEKGERLLASVQEQHGRQVQDTEEKLHGMELVVQRMESCKQLVEKMNLYASDQEVIDMYPFIRKSLEKLKREQPPVVETEIQVENFIEVKSQLQAFYERVTQEKGAAPTSIQTVANQALSSLSSPGAIRKSPKNFVLSQKPSGKSPAKRKSVQVGTTFQTPPKLIKIEPDNGEREESAGEMALEEPGTSSEGNGDSVWKGLEDTELVPEEQSPISIWESSNADTPSYLNSCMEDESSDGVECVGSSLQEDSSSESTQDNLWRSIFQPPRQLFSGEGALVFFDLKVLPGSILHLVALADKTIFSVMIQPLLSSPGGDVEGGLCEIGLEAFLRYLLSLHQPILVGYDLRSMDFPVLVNSLEAIQKEEAFKAAVFGFLDALPLIKEKVPDLPSYSLKSLDQIYFFGQLDDIQVIDCAKAVKDLCTVLDVIPGMERRPVITYSSLQCYNSLQPLLTKGLLSHSTVWAVALHGVCLSMLRSVYQKDPAHGLQRFSKYLNSRQIHGGKTIRGLSKAEAYFESLPSGSQATASVATKSEVCSCH